MRRGSVWPARGVSRRRVKRTAVFAAIAVLAFAANGLRADSGERTISIFNIHTKETVTATFKRGGKFVPHELDRLNRVMRDWRIDQKTEMDPRLIDLLWHLHTELGAKQPVHLISGFRSEQTNDMLRRTRGGQAKKSLHIQGKAADVFFPGVPLERLRNAALVRQVGGVGYYPRSGQPFVHVDTGSVRHWPRLPEAEYASILKNGGAGSSRGEPYRNNRALPAPTRVAEVVLPPRLKPDVAQPVLAESALTLAENAQVDIAPSKSLPIRFAAAGAAVLEPPRGAILPSAGGGAPDNSARDWGQSLLLPSARPANPSNLEPVRAGFGGSSRVIVTAANAPASDQPAFKGDALDPGAAMGYAGLPEPDRRDRVAGLLANGTGDLARLLAEAQYIGGRDGDAGAARPAGAPTDLRPSVMIHSRAELPSVARPLAAPLMTASLAPGRAVRPVAEPTLSQRLRARLGGPVLTAPSGSPKLGVDADLFRGLLRARADDHAMTFVRVASLAPTETTFARPAEDFAWQTEVMEPTPRAAIAETAGFTGGLVAIAERALGWILGE